MLMRLPPLIHRHEIPNEETLESPFRSGEEETAMSVHVRSDENEGSSQRRGERPQAAGSDVCKGICHCRGDLGNEVLFYFL